ncbi:hypothetical protein HMPREF9946_01550 [Acetobacteraceae bacterium AT-5844]|nr:hypothetical protein HMPREF9946_01550 [Acetobacteraceae bacterium AT-5844]
MGENEISGRAQENARYSSAENRPAAWAVRIGSHHSGKEH